MEKFSTSIRGYKKEEVNKFVDDCINKVENMLNELKQKDLEIENLKHDLVQYKNMEATFNKAILVAEDASNQIKRIARDESDRLIEAARKRIAEAPSIAKIIKETIHSNSKLIYFCPPFSEKGVNDIETIKKEAMEWFKQITGEENIVFYSTTSEMGTDGKKNREAFYQDSDDDWETL